MHKTVADVVVLVIDGDKRWGGEIEIQTELSKTWRKWDKNEIGDGHCQKSLRNLKKNV